MIQLLQLAEIDFRKTMIKLFTSKIGQKNEQMYNFTEEVNQVLALSE